MHFETVYLVLSQCKNKPAVNSKALSRDAVYFLIPLTKQTDLRYI